MSTPAPLTGPALDSFVERLQRASPLHADLLAEHGCEAVPVTSPDALGDAAVYQVTVPVRRRPIELLVADLGDDMLALGGSDGIDELARRTGLRLGSADQVADYLRFWCRVVLRPDEQLVEGALDFDWVTDVRNDPAPRAHADAAARLARPVTVTAAGSDGFEAELIVLAQRTLEHRRVRITTGGHVTVVDTTVLASDVPVVYVMP